MNVAITIILLYAYINKGCINVVILAVMVRPINCRFQYNTIIIIL